MTTGLPGCDPRFLADAAAELDVWPLFGGRSPLWVLVRNCSGPGSVILSFADDSASEVLVDGESYDFGDDFPVILGILDFGLEGGGRMAPVL